MSDNERPGDDAAPPASRAASGTESASPEGKAGEARAAASARAASESGGGDNDAPDAEPRAATPRPDVPFEQLKQIVAHLQKEIDGLTAKLEEAKAEKLRLMADMDNLRKRTEREKEETAKYAVTRFAKDIVGVVDNFERAAGAVPKDAAEGDQVLKSFLEGVELAEREFLSVLGRHGVKQIDADGQPFNPHHHQAVMEREDVSVPSGTVLQVFQAGYMIEDRCLRPSMVVVSRGGAKTPKAAASEAQQDTAPPAGTGEQSAD